MEGRAPSVLNNTKTKLRNALKEPHLNVAMGMQALQDLDG
jgi:hypothetical protein